MGWENVLKTLFEQSAIIANAPVPFGIALLIAAGVIYLIAKWMY